MRPMRARYENGALLPAKPLALRQGESVSIVVLREPDAARWDLVRLAQHSDEDAELAKAGLDAWAAALDREDHA